jgi:serine protease Do
VTVTLADGRSFRAEIVGADPAIDVALLHVSVPDRLPVAPLGNSDNLRVGQWVCAIGNPLGVYAHSVTVGVVSFLGRKVFDLSLDAYIQTDAAITFGNSGGPLINERGEVVGITTAINAQAMSIGFAVPISQVVPILPQLRERGSVARGYIGIGLTSVTPALRQALGLTPDHGALVQDVHPDTPAERAGLRTYDVIVGVDGHDIRSDEALIRYIAGRAPGTLASLRIWRNGTRRSVPVKLTVRAVERVDLTRARPADARPAAQPQTPLGIRVRDLTASDRLRLPESLQGIIVSDVDPAGPARLAQVRVGQIILEVNRESVHSVADYRTLTSRLTPGDAAAILIYDRQTNQQVIDTVVSDRLP